MKKLFNIRKIILLVILVLAAFLRIWNLGNVPPSASMDEASIGYNAYSVLKIGVDEFGEFPLISQRGYDDWRRSTYLFLTIPFIAIFGLDVISIRLPAVILSILTVWAAYHIVLLLFPKRLAISSNAALLTSFILAISPWHIYISRLGHESNACLSFLVFGVLFFLQGIKQNNWIRVFFSMIFFTLSMISYYSGQVFVPLFVAGIFFLFRKNLFLMVSANKKILVPFLGFFLLLIPIFWAIFSPQALIRFQGTSTFKLEAHQDVFDKRVRLWNKAVEDKNIVGMIANHRYLFPAQVFIEGYIAHFNPRWLFTNSSGEPHKVPYMGLLNLWEVPFLVIGIVFFFFNKNLDTRAKFLIFFWFLLGPFPAALATQTPHAMRSYNFLPTWQIFTAFGLAFLLHKLQKFNTKILTIFGFVVIFGLLTFYKNYYIIFPREQSQSFHYALAKTIPFVLLTQNNYKKIVFSNRENLYQSYMIFLYYSRYDPKLYQKQGGTISGGFAEKHAFDKFEFRPLDTVSIEDNTLYIGNSNEINKNITIIQSFFNLDGRQVIFIGKKK